MEAARGAGGQRRGFFQSLSVDYGEDRPAFSRECPAWGRGAAGRCLSRCRSSRSRLSMLSPDHKVIPVDLIIRHGFLALSAAGLARLGFGLLPDGRRQRGEYFAGRLLRWNPMNGQKRSERLFAVVAIAVWQLARAFHLRAWSRPRSTACSSIRGVRRATDHRRVGQRCSRRRACRDCSNWRRRKFNRP